MSSAQLAADRIHPFRPPACRDRYGATIQSSALTPDPATCPASEMSLCNSAAVAGARRNAVAPSPGLTRLDLGGGASGHRPGGDRILTSAFPESARRATRLAQAERLFYGWRLLAVGGKRPARVA